MDGRISRQGASPLQPLLHCPPHTPSFCSSHSEYLDVDNPGWFWTWQALLALTDVIKDVNPQLLTHALFDDEESCAVCLNTLTEKGHMSSWTQLEPCRSAALQPLPASHHPLTIAYACQALDLL